MRCCEWPSPRYPSQRPPQQRRGLDVGRNDVRVVPLEGRDAGTDSLGDAPGRDAGREPQRDRGGRVQCSGSWRAPVSAAVERIRRQRASKACSFHADRPSGAGKTYEAEPGTRVRWCAWSTPSTSAGTGTSRAPVFGGLVPPAFLRSPRVADARACARSRRRHDGLSGDLKATGCPSGDNEPQGPGFASHPSQGRITAAPALSCSTAPTARGRPPATAGLRPAPGVLPSR